MRSILQKTFLITLISLNGLFLASNTAHAGINDGLLLHYAFDSSDCQADDLSPNGYDASKAGFGITCNDGVSDYSPFSPTFSNQGDYYSAVLDDSFSVASVTISVWLKPLQSNSWDTIALVRGSVSPYYRYGLWLYPSSGKLIPYFYSNSSYVKANTGIPLNGKWYHLVASYDKGVVTIYLNGRKIVKQPVAWTLPNLAGLQPILYVANDNSTTNSYNFTGTYDELRIYNRGLSTAEVKNLYAVHSELSGAVSKGSSRFTVECTNKKTGQTVTFKSSSAWNCEQKGVAIAPGDKYEIKITGAKPSE